MIGLGAIPCFVSMKSLRILQCGVPSTSQWLWPSFWMIISIIRYAWMKARLTIDDEQLFHTCWATFQMRSAFASLLLYICNNSLCRFDIAGNICRFNTLVYGPCGAWCSSFHPRTSNSSCSHVLYVLSMWGPALSSWWTTTAPSQGPPGFTKASNSGKSTVIHSSMRGNLGLDAVP